MDGISNNPQKLAAYSKENLNNNENKENFNTINIPAKKKNLLIKTKPLIQNNRYPETQRDLNNNNNLKINFDLSLENPENSKKNKNPENNSKIVSSENTKELVKPINNHVNPKPKENKTEKIDQSKSDLLPNPKKKQTTLVDYLEKENIIIIKNYGTEIYNYMKKLENNGIPQNFSERHSINQEIRTKMVDWMIEVLSVYKSEHETFFLSVFILDMFIYKSTEIINTEDVHLIGLTSMFIASKFEDVVPIRMHSLVSKIGHDLFKPNQIVNQERKMLEIVEFDGLITSSIYEFIRTFFYDFKFNNKKYINQLNMPNQIKELEKYAIYFSKLMCYTHNFYAITCIISAFDSLRSTNKILIPEAENFFREWIVFLIDESNYSTENINEVYVKIMKYHSDYENLPMISFNLNRYPIN